MNFTFYVVAMDETQYWGKLPESCTKARGLYLVREGEATHVCSLTPSSRADFIENEFLGVDYDTPEGAEWIDEHQFDGGDEPSTYFAFIDFETTKLPHSRPIEIEADDADEAWEDALEYVRGNAQYVPEGE